MRSENETPSPCVEAEFLTEGFLDSLLIPALRWVKRFERVGGESVMLVEDQAGKHVATAATLRWQYVTRAPD